MCDRYYNLLVVVDHPPMTMIGGTGLNNREKKTHIVLSTEEFQ